MNVIRKTIALLLFIAPGVGAAEPPARSSGGPPAGDTNRFSLGIATLVGESPYRGADPRVIPVPALSYRGPRFQLNGIRASYRLSSSAFYSLSTVAQWRFSPFDPSDSPALDGMEDRDHTIDAGLRLAGPRFLPLDSGIEVRGDTLGVYNGLSAALDLGWRFRGKQGFVRPGVRLEWMSPELTSHLYGVRPGEATADRPAYEPEGSLQTSLDALAVRTVAGQWEITAMAGYVFLDREASRSPIVEKSSLWRAMAGIGYRF